MYAPAVQRAPVGLLRRTAVYICLILMGYLLQVCVVPRIAIRDAVPNIPFIIIGIITVARGKLRGFWSGLLYGILMEIMVPNVLYMNLAIYSLSSLFCSFPFADKSVKTLEYERATKSNRKELAPWIRTILCILMNAAVYEIVHLTYIYLGGNALTVGHFFRSAGTLVYTVLLGALLQLPLRRILLGPRLYSKQMVSNPVVFQKA